MENKEIIRLKEEYNSFVEQCYLQGIMLKHPAIDKDGRRFQFKNIEVEENEDAEKSTFTYKIVRPQEHISSFRRPISMLQKTIYNVRDAMVRTKSTIEFANEIREFINPVLVYGAQMHKGDDIYINRQSSIDEVKKCRLIGSPEICTLTKKKYNAIKVDVAGEVGSDVPMLKLTIGGFNFEKDRLFIGVDQHDELVFLCSNKSVILEVTKLRMVQEIEMMRRRISKIDYEQANIDFRFAEEESFLEHIKREVNFKVI